jgi:hypothetical protein
MKPLAILCQAALEQAVMAAEGPPHDLGEEAAYEAVSEEMLRQSVMAAVGAGLTTETVARIVAEALVATRKTGRAA